MSESRTRPGAPRPPAVPKAAPPVPVAAQVSPRPPQVGSPKPPAVAAAKPKIQSEPPEAGWDDAPTATSIPDDSGPVTPVRLPAVAMNESPMDETPLAPPVMKSSSVPPPALAAPPPRARSAPPPPPPLVAAAAPPAAAATGLSASMRDEVWAIVRAAVEEGVKPVLAKNKDLEARLASAEARAQKQQVQIASIPVAVGTSVAPAAIPRAPTAPSIERQGSLPPTGYGVAVVTAPKPAVDLAALAKIPVEMDGAWDGGKRKRRLGKIVVGLLFVGILAMIVLTIMSHNGG